jgi:hypothetical protein
VSPDGLALRDRQLPVGAAGARGDQCGAFGELAAGAVVPEPLSVPGFVTVAPFVGAACASIDFEAEPVFPSAAALPFAAGDGDVVTPVSVFGAVFLAPGALSPLAGLTAGVALPPFAPAAEGALPAGVVDEVGLAAPAGCVGFDGVAGLVGTAAALFAEAAPWVGVVAVPGVEAGVVSFAPVGGAPGPAEPVAGAVVAEPAGGAIIDEFEPAGVS